MKNIVKAIAYLPKMEGDGSRPVYFSFTVSIIFHLLFLTVLIFVPGLKVPGSMSRSVIHVNMVGLPAKGTSLRVKSSAPLKQSAVVTQKKAEGSSVKTVSISPQKKTKPSTKKPTTPANTVKDAVEQIKDKSEVSRSKDVTDALEKIRGKVEEEEANRIAIQNSNEELAGSVGIESGVEGGTGIGGSASLDILTLYTYEIKDLVEQNWAYSESLAGAKPDLHVLLVFEVLPNGEIRDIWFTEKSGNKYLDESAYKAVIKSKPFPPHPRELSRSTVTVPLRFTPKGLQK
ncbi:MAG: TonB C-terminal domain-containing protein [Desulfobacterales bacterium]|nr:TonB C-terminal domain-containing protein [Desulfobacterales bacterium]